MNMELKSNVISHRFTSLLFASHVSSTYAEPIQDSFVWDSRAHAKTRRRKGEKELEEDVEEGLLMGFSNSLRLRVFA